MAKKIKVDENDPVLMEMAAKYEAVATDMRNRGMDLIVLSNTVWELHDKITEEAFWKKCVEITEIQNDEYRNKKHK